MTLSVEDIDKMKVADLKTELGARGLDTKGLKKDLAERLKAAIEADGGEESQGNDKEAEAEGETDNPESSEDSLVSETVEQTNIEETPEQEKEEEEVETPVKEEEKTTTLETRVENHNITETAGTEDAEMSSIQDQEDKESKEANPDDSTAAVYGGKDETMAELDESIKAETENAEDIPAEGESVKAKEEAVNETKKSESEQKEERGAKRKREEPAPVFDTVELDEPVFDKDAVGLDWYNSDLHLIIDRETMSKASPLSNGGFAYIWAGVRATYGVKSGKVAFEVKLTEENNTTHLVNEVDPHVLRIGFSTDDTSMQLGEEPLSFGYGGTGKKSVNLQFSSYGVAFGLNDVVTAYLEMDDEYVSISYAKNGEDLGEAFKVPMSELGEKALFPHVLTKNYQYECNFGQLAEPWFPIKEEFTFVGKVPVEDRVRGTEPPATRSECEIVMLVGIPGSGKTTWANKYAQEHPEKKYNILGTNALIDKMKVAGLNRKRNYAGRWDQLIQKCTDCLNRLLVLAAKRKRNYILDQTNVYPSARRRKLKCYGDFIRRAVVIVPTDEEFKNRVAKREAEEGKDVPDEAVLEMKANFRLPEDGPLFTSVEYVELDAEEAAKVVQEYNAEGVKAGYGPSQKRARLDDRRPISGDRRVQDDRRRDHRRNDSWGGRSEREYRPRFEERRPDVRDQRRSFEQPRRDSGGYGGRMPPSGPPQGRYGGYSGGGYGGPPARGGGGYGDRDRSYGGGGDYRRGSSGGGGGGDYRRGTGDRRGGASAGGASRYGAGSSPGASRGYSGGARSQTWEQPQQQSWSQPPAAAPAAAAAAAAPAWGQQQGWNQAAGYYDPAAYGQYAQQGYWNGQSYDYQAAWQQQQQMYYQQAAGTTPANTAAGAQATQQGTWKSY